MDYVFNDNKIYITDVYGFDIAKTFECGQCFRFDRRGSAFVGVVGGRAITVSECQNGVCIEGISKKEFEQRFIDYFDLKRDYREVEKALCQDKVLKDIIPFSTGIRILKQDPFETLVSFIISAANNIPRIKKIITSLCQSFGTAFEADGTTFYQFPSAQKLAGLSLAELSVIKAGFRTEYILDCAKKVASGELDLELVAKQDYETAAKMLMQVKGVGRKVADCTLLFGFGFVQSFPKDVWIKRILKALYNTDSEKSLEFYGFGGIAQQYLFYYARETQLNDIT